MALLGRTCLRGLILSVLISALWSLAWSADGSGGLTSDWDWGAIEALDDTPTTPQQSVREVPASVPMERPSMDDVTQPDMQREAHQVYSLFAGMPEFKVIPSRIDKDMHPCSNCHEWQEAMTTPRKLNPPHDNFELKHGLHGKGQFWCFSCHDNGKDRQLRTMEGESLPFEDAYILCSQCHVNQARDWAYGAHGKRVGNWQGERVVYNCTACHYQHAPGMDTRTAMPGPEIRMQLPRPAHWMPAAQRQGNYPRHEASWEKRLDDKSEGGS